MKDVASCLRERENLWWNTKASGWTRHMRQSSRADRAMWSSGTLGWRAAYGVRGYWRLRFGLTYTALHRSTGALSRARTAACLLCGQVGGMQHLIQHCRSLDRARREYLESWPEVTTIAEDLGEETLRVQGLRGSFVERWRALYVFAGAISTQLDFAADKHRARRQRQR